MIGQEPMFFFEHLDLLIDRVKYGQAICGTDPHVAFRGFLDPVNDVLHVTEEAVYTDSNEWSYLVIDTIIQSGTTEYSAFAIQLEIG